MVLGHTTQPLNTSFLPWEAAGPSRVPANWKVLTARCEALDTSRRCGLQPDILRVVLGRTNLDTELENSTTLRTLGGECERRCEQIQGKGASGKWERESGLCSYCWARNTGGLCPSSAVLALTILHINPLLHLPPCLPRGQRLTRLGEHKGQLHLTEPRPFPGTPGSNSGHGDYRQHQVPGLSCTLPRVARTDSQP